MDKSEVDAALYWLSWINAGKIVATLLVALGVAGEFAGDFLAKPFNKTVEAARQEEIARLNNDSANANARLAEASKATAELSRALAGERMQRLEIERELHIKSGRIIQR